MRKWKVDYTELVEALQERNNSISNKQLNELRPRLVTYLRVTMDASPENAEDAVQQAFLKTYSQLMEGGLKVKKYFFKYLLQACRGEYLHIMELKASQNIALSNASEYLVSAADQIEKLQDKDRQKLLKACIETLKEKYKEFVTYYCGQSEWDSKAAAEHFGISNDYARMMQTRTIRKLSKCIKMKLGE